MGPPPGPVVAQLQCHLWIRYPLCFKRFVQVFIVFSTHWVNISFEVLLILRCWPTPRRGVRGSQLTRLRTECAQNVSDFSHYPYLLLFVAIHRPYLLLVVANCFYSPSLFIAICCYSPSLFIHMCCYLLLFTVLICCYLLLFTFLTCCYLLLFTVLICFYLLLFVAILHPYLMLCVAFSKSNRLLVMVT